MHRGEAEYSQHLALLQDDKFVAALQVVVKAVPGRDTHTLSKSALRVELRGGQKNVAQVR